MSNIDRQADDHSLNGLIESKHSVIRDAVGLALHLYHQHVSKDVIDELTAELEYLLIKDDYHKLRSFKRKSSFKTWIKSIAFHHIGRYLKKQQSAPQSLEDLTLTTLISPATQERKVINDDLLRLVDEAMKNLRERDLLLFRLCFIEELEASEVATIMGIKLESVYQRKSAILKKLRLFINGKRGGVNLDSPSH